MDVSDRERCGFSDVTGNDLDGEPRLILTDREGHQYPKPINLPISTLFPKGRRLERIVQSRKPKYSEFGTFKSVKSRFTASESLSDRQLLIQTAETILK